MDRTQFKLRMKSLKSYREQNPGKGYWDWKALAFEDGGEVESKYPQFINGQRVNRWTGLPIATGQATPVLDLRTAVDFTPVGDALAVNYAYQAIKNRDWLGAEAVAANRYYTQQENK